MDREIWYLLKKKNINSETKVDYKVQKIDKKWNERNIYKPIIYNSKLIFSSSENNKLYNNYSNLDTQRYLPFWIEFKKEKSQFLRIIFDKETIIKSLTFLIDDTKEGIARAPDKFYISCDQTKKIEEISLNRKNFLNGSKLQLILEKKIKCNSLIVNFDISHKNENIIRTILVDIKNEINDSVKDNIFSYRLFEKKNYSIF